MSNHSRKITNLETLTKTTIKIKDIIDFLYDFFPSKDAEKWDNCQLINTRWKHKKPQNVVVGLDLFQSDLPLLAHSKTNFIITHHPLWITHQQIDNGVKFLKKFLNDHQIVFLALHTQFDKNHLGTNFQIIEKVPLFKLGKIKQKGFLSYVELSPKTDINHLIQTLKTSLQINECKFCFYRQMPQISKLVLCAGSGYELVHEIDWKKADVFITGDLKYHDWVNAERNHYNIIDIGHEIENVFGIYLKLLLENKFSLKIKILKNKRLFFVK